MPYFIKQKLFDVYLKFFLLGCMVFYVPGQQFYVPQEMFFQYGVFGFLVISWIVERKRDVSNFYFGAILGYALLNTILCHFTPESRMKLLNLFLGSILIKEISERITLDFKSIGKFLALFCAFNVFWLVLQIKGVDPIFTSLFRDKMPQIDHVGFMGLKANLGVLAALCAPFIYYSNPFNLIICLPLLYFGQSSTAVAAFVVTVLCMLWFDDKKKLFWWILGIIVPLGAYYVLKIDMPEGQFSKRLFVWGAGVNYLAGSGPWFGNGLGSWATTGFTTIQENGEPQTWIWAHSSYIQFLFELGLVGIVLMYAFFKNIFTSMNFQRYNHRKAFCILIPLLLVAVFHFPERIGRFAGLTCYIFACVFALLTAKVEV